MISLTMSLTVVQRADKSIQRITRHLVDEMYQFQYTTYPLDRVIRSLNNWGLYLILLKAFSMSMCTKSRSKKLVSIFSGGCLSLHQVCNVSSFYIFLLHAFLSSKRNNSWKVIQLWKRMLVGLHCLIELHYLLPFNSENCAPT